MSLFGFGFFDFPLITMHIAKQNILNTEYLPLFYAGAMFIAAFSSLIFGRLFDRLKIRTLAISTLISSPFAYFVFATENLWLLIIGIFIWGIGIGAQETLIKSSVTILVSHNNRSKGFGLVNLFLGISWFCGSWLCGVLYDVSVVTLVLFSFIMQIGAVILFYISNRK